MTIGKDVWLYSLDRHKCCGFARKLLPPWINLKKCGLLKKSIGLKTTVTTILESVVLQNQVKKQMIRYNFSNTEKV